MIRTSPLILALLCSLLWSISPRNSIAATSTPDSSPTADFAAIDDIVDLIDAARMVGNVHTLATEIGVRPAGSEKEREAANFIAHELESYGYLVSASSFVLDSGLESENILAELPGECPEAILIGAHYDSKPPSPGANDNASGIAVLLEVARALADTEPPYTVIFVAFGAEEVIDGNPDHHHYGSRRLAADDELVTRLLCMSSVDMVGVGSELWLDNMGMSDDGWRSHVAECARAMGLAAHTGERRAWSDHEAFERHGVPAAWIHWRYDGRYHTSADVPDRVKPELLHATAELLVRAVLGIDGATVVRLRDQSDLGIL